MKRSLFITMLLAGIQLQALAQISIKPEIGLNLSNYTIREEFAARATQLKSLPLAGVAVDARISPKLAIESGLFYKQNGFKLTEYEYSEDLTIHSVEVPLNLLYTPDTRSKNLSFGVGLYCAYHAKGRAISNGRAQDLKFANDVSSSQYYVAKPLDFGLRFVSTLKLSNSLYLKAHFERSTGNLSLTFDAPDPQFVVKNYNYGISLGYNLFQFWKASKSKMSDL